MNNKNMFAERDGHIGCGCNKILHMKAVTDRPVLPRPYWRRVPKGVVTVLEGARVLARGTRSCT